jgi:hypothetical protein
MVDELVHRRAREPVSWLSRLPYRDGEGRLMPRTEARIFTSIWKDGDFLSLPPTAQRLYMFLLSQPELTYCGTMPLRQARWVPKASGLTLADIERDLKELEGSAYPTADPPELFASPGPLRSPFVITDSETGELFVRSLLRRDNAWKQPNLLKQAMDASDEIESPRILLALLAEVRRLPVDDSPSEQVKTLIAQWIKDLEQGTPHPSAYPPPNSTDYPEDDPSAEGSDDSSDNPSGDPSDNGRPRAGSSNPPIPIPPTNLPAPSKDRKQGTRLPDDFMPSPEMFEWFRKSCPHVDGKTEHAQFCDYWRAKPGAPGRKLDWPATWRNWMRTAEARSQPRARPGQRPQAPVSLADEWKLNRS